jgi:hypothetical protein
VTAQSARSVERAVVTLAVGKPLYVNMAIALARSFKWWHRHSDIRFAIATDRADLIPPDLADVIVVPLTPGQFGTGFTPKLYLDQFAPGERTIFLDSDSLIVGSLATVFDRFAGRRVAVVGGTIASGEWFGNVADVRARFGLEHLVKFNGGLYYTERGPDSAMIYDFARSLVPDYDEIGFRRLRGKPNEEVLMAVAMAKYGADPLPDDGTVMGDLFSYSGKLEMDVLKGGATLRNPPAPHPDHRDWNEHAVAHPLIVHFLDVFTTTYPYRREERRLALVARGWPVVLADGVAALTRSIPLLAVDRLKQLLRPVYRRIFGYRPVAVSPRI